MPLFDELVYQFNLHDVLKKGFIAYHFILSVNDFLRSDRNILASLRIYLYYPHLIGSILDTYDIRIEQFISGGIIWEEAVPLSVLRDPYCRKY
jgi:hypothetical protein